MAIDRRPPPVKQYEASKRCRVRLPPPRRSDAVAGDLGLLRRQRGHHDERPHWVLVHGSSRWKRSSRTTSTEFVFLETAIYWQGVSLSALRCFATNSVLDIS
jgi:hypothetical protein